MSFLNFLNESSNRYQGRKVTLNKPFRTPDGPKKFSVYVKNDKGNVVKVNFGDPDMDIKRDQDERRKSFRARHNCDNPGPKWKARYWSCKMWEKSKSVSDLTEMQYLEPSTENEDIIESYSYFVRTVQGAFRVDPAMLNEKTDLRVDLQHNIKMLEDLSESDPKRHTVQEETDAIIDFLSRGKK